MNLNLVQDDLLIRRLRDLHDSADTTSFNVLDFASAFGNPLDALVYSRLFWPDFVDFKGAVLPATFLESEQDRSRIQDALSASTPAEVERSWNRFEIPSDFFASHRFPTTDAENLELAERMAQSWRARLLQLFPDRSFTVQVEHEPEEPPTLVFFQCRCKTEPPLE